MITKTQKETLEFLKARARGETENRDNIFLIAKKACKAGTYNIEWER